TGGGRGGGGDGLGGGASGGAWGCGSAGPSWAWRSFRGRACCWFSWASRCWGTSSTGPAGCGTGCTVRSRRFEGGSMEDSKDRLGKRLQEREKGEENRFFEEQDRQAIERLKRKRVMGVDESTKGHCPRCGATLNPVEIRGVE